MVGAALRVLGFEVKGLASAGLWIVRRRHGVPPGASAVTYAKEQTFVLALMLFAMAIETVVVDLLLVAVGVPGWLRYTVLIADLYGLLFGVLLAAACATRPHVITDDELRIRYAAYFDVRVPLDRIVSVRTGRNLNEDRMVSVADGQLGVAVASQTNLTVELAGPVTVVRPLGRRAEVTSIRFFADDPEAVLAALRPRLTVPS
ncbi:hypothetical protein [Nonomuraea diastatica]|uniref:PH domain-containing protein n=1 Tax=Nonomuraea diastatica TaxID=1848329 RepID=A0A4R4WGL5_9ACTN|nr:hypothetical protein [Nonomuraea diastatica]TDD14635.1 hypothetical protein E1294_36930 [Nonomuraea diastatica]